MRHILFFMTFVLVTSTLSAQVSLVKIWQSDTVSLRNPESVLYDSASNLLYVSCTGSGSIARMNLNGKVIDKDWVTGLNANKGMGLFNGLLYTAEPSAVAVIDVDKHAIVKRIPIEGARMLNDITIDSKGVVYVSDTWGEKVYKIVHDHPKLYLDHMPGANGLLAVNSDLYLVTSTSFLKADDKGKVQHIAYGFETGLDGMVMISDHAFIISNYRGILWYVKTDGTRRLLLDTRAKRIMSNDIDYNPKTKTLYVPSFGTNCVLAYQVEQTYLRQH